jgi:hypothetical protein
VDDATTAAADATASGAAEGQQQALGVSWEEKGARNPRGAKQPEADTDEFLNKTEAFLNQRRRGEAREKRPPKHSGSKSTSSLSAYKSGLKKKSRRSDSVSSKQKPHKGNSKLVLPNL